MKLDFCVRLGLALSFAAFCGAGSQAQQPEFTNNFKYNRGQGVQPIFEGWSYAPDGRVQMHFGYLNRNYVEQPTIPVGPDNKIEPAGPDRGQPTFFYNRTHRNLFTVVMPKEWSKTQELIWTITIHGRTERAVGWLQPEWEIDPNGGASGGGNTDPEILANKRPTITVDPPAPLASPATLTLTAAATDDGLPKPRPKGKPAVGQETPPTLVGGTDAPVNVPALAGREGPVPGAATRPDGLTVSWIVWRGPAAASFEPRYAKPADGKAQTTATFTKPGEYVLRATAFDGSATTHAQAAVSVGAPRKP